MTHLKSRIEKLESKSLGVLHTGVIRIIQDGELTASQVAEIEAARTAGKFIIIRKII